MLKNRKSPRAQRYDYSSAGAYFITMCTKNRKHYFGNGSPKEGRIILSDIGKICELEIQTMMYKRSDILLDEYIIMPNHIHFLLIINSNSNSNSCTDVGLPRPRPYITNNMGTASGCPYKKFDEKFDEKTNEKPDAISNNDLHNTLQKNTLGNITNQSVGSIIGGFKSAVSRKCNQQGLSFARQSRYHDHIIRNKQEYNRIKYYIQQNPKKRKEDKFSNQTP